MSTLMRGLGDIKREMDKRAENNAPGTKARWLTLKDGQSVKIRFVEEAYADSPFYDEARGLFLTVKEHKNPDDWRRKAFCSIEEEGRCYGCERHRQDPKAKWYSTMRLYSRILVDDGENEPSIYHWSTGASTKSAVFTMIRDFADDNGSVSNLVWKFKRTGLDKETSYSLIPGATDSSTFDWSGFTLPPLELALRKVPYSEQENFYLGTDNPAVSTDADWD